MPLLLPDPTTALGRSVALAVLNSHRPPGFESWLSLPLQILCHFRLPLKQVAFFSIIVLVVLVQYLQPPRLLLEPIITDRRHPFSKVCLNHQILRQPLPICSRSKMGLVEDARTVAAEFDYSVEDVNKGVKAFIRQMGQYSKT